MKNKRVLVLGVALALFAMVAGVVFAQSGGLESGGYIRQSDSGKGRVAMIDIGYPNSNGEIVVAYLESNGNERWEKKAKVSSGRLHLVPTSSSFNRVAGDGVLYFDIVSSTSFRWDGVLWVKGTR